MPVTPPPISFTLPNRQAIEGYVITLLDGRKVLRTREELAPAPRK